MIILMGQLFRDAYGLRRYDPALLSRSIEEGSTLTAALIPWTTTGIFYASTLGLSVLDYAPYAVLNWLNALRDARRHLRGQVAAQGRAPSSR